MLSDTKWSLHSWSLLVFILSDRKLLLIMELDCKAESFYSELSDPNVLTKEVNRLLDGLLDGTNSAQLG